MRNRKLLLSIQKNSFVVESTALIHAVFTVHQQIKKMEERLL